ncbi:NlpC/P60 family protein [Nonomuraea sp. NEAU-A123]|uniref:C40 family peptidase n=1 Tax=Nonomuraea sp. NEAU-A123 TaxID=2839649 RepID=UPI001BE45548|nr:NlpC/P60 family protein [Nonomuraea sp. NEAU-A123]MBT2233109.1 C40 family peptidase [Nonomuraea sp. NEAU-A123]
MKYTRNREGKPAGAHARPPGSRNASTRLGVIAAAVATLLFAVPVGSAAADPKPSLKALSKQAEELHTQIETLSEQYNGQREKLKTAKKAVEAAQKTLATSESDLATKRAKASMLAQSAYINGGLGQSLAFTTSDDPESFLDRAATTYAIEQQQGAEVNLVTAAREAAERARTSAKTRIDEVQKIVDGLDTKRDKITTLVAKVESSLFKRAIGEAGRPGSRAVRVNLPVIGAGKAAIAARWALTQQLKPYVWGAEGPSSYDCSGLVMAAYQRVGISLPHYTGDQWTAGRHISKEELRAGDLVFFYGDLHHVGIYIGGGMMVHAPQTGDVVRIASIARRPFAGAVRIAD